MKTIGVLTSGGDAPGMNAAIRAVVRYGIYNDINVLGINKGYRGLIENDIEKMDLSSVADIIHRGGTALGTARCKKFMTEEGFQEALDTIKYRDIDGIVVIGGDGSFKGAKELSEAGVKTVGIPGTIDNDLAYTDYTIGFSTALETILDAISKIRDTSSSHERTIIMEVMGRNCGDLALYSGLAGGAEMVLIPEIQISIEKVADKINQGMARGKKHSIIMLAEGAGDAYSIRDQINKHIDVPIRCTVLGYIQRGGTPVSFDRLLGSRMGANAVKCLIDNEAFELTKILSI